MLLVGLWRLYPVPRHIYLRIWSWNEVWLFENKWRRNIT